LVNHPEHYTAGKVECIDALEAATTGLEGLEAICTGNAIKYLWRWKHKNGVEDLKKARWYLNRLIASLENTKSARQDPVTETTAETELKEMLHFFRGPDRKYVPSAHPLLMYVFEDGKCVGYYAPDGLTKKANDRLEEIMKHCPSADPATVIWMLVEGLWI